MRHTELIDTIPEHIERVFDRTFSRLTKHLDHFVVRTVGIDLLAQLGSIKDVAQLTAVRKFFVGIGKEGDIIARTVFLSLPGLLQSLIENRILAVVRQGADHILNRDLQHDVHTATQVETEVDLLLFTLIVIELNKSQIVNGLGLYRIQIFGLY